MNYGQEAQKEFAQRQIARNEMVGTLGQTSTKRGDVEIRLERLESETYALMAIIDQLESRLGPIMPPPMPLCEETNKQADNPSCVVSVEIHASYERVQRAVTRLHRLLDLIQL